MYVFLINTSRPDALVAIVQNGHVLGQRCWPADQQLGVRLLQHTGSLLRDVGVRRADIGRIGVHPGPGHYSALRTGVVTATILAQALNAGLVPVQINNDDVKAAADKVLRTQPVGAVMLRYA